MDFIVLFNFNNFFPDYIFTFSFFGIRGNYTNF
eukprot:UN11797